MKAPVVVVISPEWTLRTMVRAELREAGIKTLGMEGANDLAEALALGVSPSVVVLDGVELENPAARQALENLPRNVAVLVVDSRITPAPTLPSAEVLRRPIRVQDIVSHVLARLSA
jgi:AmiR/NasT family two-component response regulator